MGVGLARRLVLPAAKRGALRPVDHPCRGPLLLEFFSGGGACSPTAVLGAKFDIGAGKAAEIGASTGLGSDNNKKLVDGGKKAFFNWVKNYFNHK
eukprot:1184535-Prorocentrum_minimum.AAC.1